MISKDICPSSCESETDGDCRQDLLALWCEGCSCGQVLSGVTAQLCRQACLPAGGFGMLSGWLWLCRGEVQLCPCQRLEPAVQSTQLVTPRLCGGLGATSSASSWEHHCQALPSALPAAIHIPIAAGNAQLLCVQGKAILCLPRAAVPAGAAALRAPEKSPPSTM